MRNFAQLLVTYEQGEKTSPAPEVPVVFAECEKLRPSLARLTGNAGFRALLARALTLAGAEVGWLRALQVKGDGSLEGGEKLREQIGAPEFFEGRVVLLAQLIGLLVAFIGEGMVLRLVGETWPEIPLSALNFNEGKNQNEKTQ